MGFDFDENSFNTVEPVAVRVGLHFSLLFPSQSWHAKDRGKYLENAEGRDV